MDMDEGTKKCITCLTWIPGIVGIILYSCSLHKAGLYLILANAVVLLLGVCWSFYAVIESQSTDAASVGCTFCIAVTFLLGVTVTCIVMLVFAYKNGEKVNYFHVNQVDLTQFGLIASHPPEVSNSSALSYTLSLSVRLGPNYQEKVHYEDLRAWAYYQGHNFTSLSLNQKGPCSSGYYNSSSGTLRLVFQGQQRLVLTGDGLRRYRLDAAARRFSISVTLSYSGFRAGKEWSDDLRATNNETAITIKATEYSDPIKGVVTFELKDVPLSNAPATDDSSTFIVNGGSVIGGAAAAA